MDDRKWSELLSGGRGLAEWGLCDEPWIREHHRVPFKWWYSSYRSSALWVKRRRSIFAGSEQQKGHSCGPLVLLLKWCSSCLMQTSHKNKLIHLHLLPFHIYFLLQTQHQKSMANLFTALPLRCFEIVFFVIYMCAHIRDGHFKSFFFLGWPIRPIQLD